MKNQRGFIGVGVLIAILVGLAVLGGGAYYVMQQQAPTQTASDNFDNLQQLPTTNNQVQTQTTANVPVQKTTEIVPDLTKYIERSQVGVQGVVSDPKFNDSIKSAIQNGQYKWHTNPLEVAKKYASQFGIGNGAQFSLEKAPTMGDASGLWHASVLVSFNSKQYSINLTAEPSDAPLIWRISAVIDKQLFAQEQNKFRVNGTFTDSDDGDYNAIKNIKQSLDDGSTVFWLNIKKSKNINFSLNNQADSATVNSDTVSVKINGVKISGAVATAITETLQSGDHDGPSQEFQSYSIRVSLSNVSNLEQYVGQNVEITLAEKIKDINGVSLEACTKANNVGECFSDASGQKIKSYSSRVKLYSL